MRPLAFVCLAIVVLVVGLMAALFVRERERGRSATPGHGPGGARDGIAEYSDRKDDGRGGHGAP